MRRAARASPPRASITSKCRRAVRDQPNKRLSKPEFDALPLQERIGLLVQGTLRFYRGEREVPASDAMRAAY